MISKQILTIISAVLSLSILFLATLTHAATVSTGKYRVYTVDGTTRQTTLVQEGTESKKAKVTRICQQASKKYKEYGISCLWNGKIIFTKKAPKRKKSEPIEVREFVGLINGRTASQFPNMTREKAIEFCNLIISGNRGMDVSCSWGAESIGSQTAETMITPGTIELGGASQDSSTGKYIARNREQRIGSFSIRYNGTGSDAQIEKIILNNQGSTKLLSIVDFPSSAKLIDTSTNTAIKTKVNITDMAIEFSEMNELIKVGTTKQYAVILSTTNYPATSEGSAIGLVLTPENITVNTTDKKRRVAITSGNTPLKAYIIDTLPPSASITNVGENLFRLSITNNDENYPILLSSITSTVSFGLSSGQTFNGVLCGRERESGALCGTSGTSSSANVPSTSNTISFANAAMEKYILPKKSYEIDFYIMSDSLFPIGGSTQIIIENIGYIIDNKNLVEKFSGVVTGYRK